MPQEPTAYFKFNQIHFNKKTLLTVLKALPLILLLFFIFPRFYGFFPSVNNQSLGQIGYATKINNSTFSGLSTNGKTAFYVEMNKTLPPNQLYWRGRVLTQTDGYNWNSTNGTLSKNKIKFHSNNYELISYNMKYEQSFDGDIILLDTPYLIKDINLRYYREGQFQSFKTYQKKKKATLSAQSYVNSPINQSSIERKKYLQLPKFIPKSIQSIHARIKASDPNDFILNFKKYLKKEGYLYTLNPGVMRVMNDFIKNKKGYCTHFASLLGILLRMNNKPTRLVSGFQGGIYNELGQYYLINSNDAHAWVEFYHKNQWHRVDPTEFVSPFRITQGGDAFLTQRPIELDQNYISKNFNYLKKYINNINYKLALFMDNFDRNSQEEIAKKFKLSIRTFYILGALLFSAFLIFSFKYRNRKKIYNSKIDYYFYKFSNKCLKNGITIQEHQTPANIIEVLKASNLPHEYIDFIQEYSLRRYGIDKETSKLKQIISQI
jgi:transglutaminase-like putative cysteine protease